jgi:hypothetical protein
MEDYRKPERWFLMNIINFLGYSGAEKQQKKMGTILYHTLEISEIDLKYAL